MGYTYAPLERLLTAVDSGGHAVELGYNDYDQVTAIKVGSGAAQKLWALRSFDEYGRLTNSMDRNGVSTTNQFDVLDRLIERDGLLWVEDLPLSAGTNTLILTMSDAAGNVSVTNLSVIQSAVSLTLDDLSEANVNQPKITVSGEINVSDHKIWVNGMEVTNVSGGTWYVEGVPVPEGGTAVIQAVAIPTSDNGGNGTGGSGGSSATLQDLGNPASADGKQVEGTQDKQPEIVAIHYHKDWTYDSIELLEEYPLSDHETERIRWDLDQSGSWIWDACWGVVDDSYYQWGHGIWDESQLGVQWGGVTRGPQTEVCGVRDYHGDDYPYEPPGTWPGETCKGGARRRVDGVFHVYQEVVTREALTRYELHTGGKKVSGQRNLFVLSASAGGVGNLFYPEISNNPEGYPIANNQIVLGDLGKLGSDGLLYKALGDGETYNVTPIVAGSRYYTYGQPGISKYKPVIVANAIPLDPDEIVDGAEFCVGQKVMFTVEWDSTPPGIASSPSPKYDWVASARCVNTNWYRQKLVGDPDQGVPPTWVEYGSQLHANEPSHWRVAQPHAWWISGGEKNVTLNLTMYFDNGQSVKLGERGKFKTLKPFVTRLEPYGPFAADIDTSELLPSLSLMDGPMYFDVFISKTYPGKFGITQLVKMFSQTMIQLPPYFIWHSTLGSFWLDGQDEFYDGETEINLGSWPSNDEFSTPSSIFDMPGQTLAYVMGSYNGDWKCYVRFTPAGIESIPITLARIDWRWAATADQGNPGGWAVTSDGVDGPVLYDDDSFPEWTGVRPASKDSP